MLENNARSTFSNIEAKFLYFMQMNLRPRARIYEQEFDWKLLGNDPNFYTSYNINAIMRADAAARATYYMTMVQNGIMSRNEIRRLENLNNADGGDEFLTPMNMTTDSQRDKDMELKDKQVNEPSGKAQPEDVENIEATKD
jgi:phage portal protein BeeE